MRLRNIPRASSILEASPHVVSKTDALKGQWCSHLFGNQSPLHIEVGMGKGQFILELSKRHPDINFVGIERYSSVLLRGIEKLDALSSTGKEYPNLRFLCLDAVELQDIFAPQEIQTIYLNFSDPWPKARHKKRRLTASPFLSIYHNLLNANGTLEFKTDNRPLFDFSIQEITDSPLFTLTSYTYDLYHHPLLNQGNIQTEYEEKFSSKGNPICKLICRKISSSPFLHQTQK